MAQGGGQETPPNGDKVTVINAAFVLLRDIKPSASNGFFLGPLPMSFKRFFLLLSAAWFSAALAGAVHAEADVLVRESLTLVEQGKAQQAFDQLAAAEAERAGDPDFDTVLGIAANDTGQFTRAVFALERVLTVQPGNSRARAELGRALFALGDNQAARQVLQETKRDAI